VIPTVASPEESSSPFIDIRSVHPKRKRELTGTAFLLNLVELV